MSIKHGAEYEARILGLLHAIRSGDRPAFDALIEAIGQDMRKLSAYQLRQFPPGPTLQTTALVNEAVLRLVQMLNREAKAFPETREHLIALVSQMIRFTLVDYARKRRLPTTSLDAPRRGDDGEPGTETVADMLADWSAPDLDGLIAVDEALQSLERSDRDYGGRRSTAIGLHLFGGMNFREIADHLGVSDDTVRRDCRTALVQLRSILGNAAPDAALGA